MEERDVKIGAHQHAEANLAQVAPVLLVVAAGGQAGPGAGIDEGEEIGAVIDQSTQREAQLADEPLRESACSMAAMSASLTWSIWFQNAWLEELVGGGRAGRRGRTVWWVPLRQLSLAGGGERHG